jgi:hypothetical protein
MSSKVKQQKKKSKVHGSKPTVSRVAPVTQKQSGSIGRSILKGAGQTLGGLIGLGDIGSSVGDFVSNIVGLGDYTVNKNTFMKGSDSIPSFSHMDDSITVTHREYVGDVLSSTGFSLSAYDINPSNPQLFPWLSLLTDAFEQYEFEGLVMAFNPTAGDAVSSTNNALGTVVMSTEYDVSRPLFTSKMEMENYEYSTSCKPSDPMLHPIECNPHLDIVNSRYIGNRFRTTTSGSTARHDVEDNLLKLGRFQLATVGMQAANINVGELWVTYRVRLLKPRIADSSAYQGVFHATMQCDVLNATPASVYAGNWVVQTDSTSTLNGVKFASVGPLLQPTGQVINFNKFPPNTRFSIVHSIYDGSQTLSFVTAGFVGGSLVSPGPANRGYPIWPGLAVQTSNITSGLSQTQKINYVFGESNDNGPVQVGQYTLNTWTPTGNVQINHDLMITVVPAVNYGLTGTVPVGLTNQVLEQHIRGQQLEIEKSSLLLEKVTRLLSIVEEDKDESGAELISVPNTPIPSRSSAQLRSILSKLTI